MHLWLNQNNSNETRKRNDDQLLNMKERNVYDSISETASSREYVWSLFCFLLKGPLGPIAGSWLVNWASGCHWDNVVRQWRDWRKEHDFFVGKGAFSGGKWECVCEKVESMNGERHIMGTEQISLLGEGPPKPSRQARTTYDTPWSMSIKCLSSIKILPVRWRSLLACLLSILASLAILLPSTHILLHLPHSWERLAAKLRGWVAEVSSDTFYNPHNSLMIGIATQAKLDAAVSQHLLACLAWIGEGKSNLVAGFATAALLHLLLSLLLLAGSPNYIVIKMWSLFESNQI